jgi:hypothetical protein
MKQKTEFRIWWMHYWMAPFAWSRWADICTFSFGSNAYLLQGKVNRKSNAKKFRVTAMKRTTGVADVGHMKMERLTECGLIDEMAKWNG